MLVSVPSKQNVSFGPPASAPSPAGYWTRAEKRRVFVQRVGSFTGTKMFS